MSEDPHWPTVLLIGAAHSPRGASGEALERDFPRASRLRRKIAYILTLLFSSPRSKGRPSKGLTCCTFPSSPYIAPRIIQPLLPHHIYSISLLSKWLAREDVSTAEDVSAPLIREAAAFNSFLPVGHQAANCPKAGTPTWYVILHAYERGLLTLPCSYNCPSSFALAR